MKAADELPLELWPFTKAEIYAFVLDGARLAFHEPPDPLVTLRLEDVVQTKHELAAALKTVRNPRLNDDGRKRAAARVAELRGNLVKMHLWLRKRSIGFRVSPAAPIQRWAS